MIESKHSRTYISIPTPPFWLTFLLLVAGLGGLAVAFVHFVITHAPDTTPSAAGTEYREVSRKPVRHAVREGEHKWVLMARDEVLGYHATPPLDLYLKETPSGTGWTLVERTKVIFDGTSESHETVYSLEVCTEQFEWFLTH